MDSRQSAADICVSADGGAVHLAGLLHQQCAQPVTAESSWYSIMSPGHTAGWRFSSRQQTQVFLQGVAQCRATDATFVAAQLVTAGCDPTLVD